MRRGQFYLIAAFVIIALIVSFVAVTNGIFHVNKETVFDLKEELQIEGEQVINYGIVNDTSNKTELVEKFSAAFAERADDKQVIFVYGNGEDVTAYQYQENSTGSIAINYGGTTSSVDIIKRSQQEIPSETFGKIVKVNVNNQQYEFDLEQGQNFYFIIIANEGGNVNVATA